VAELIRAELEEGGRSAADLAELLGLGRSAVRRRLSGVTPFDLVEVELIAAWLNTTAPELLRRA